MGRTCEGLLPKVEKSPHQGRSTGPTNNTHPPAPSSGHKPHAHAQIMMNQEWIDAKEQVNAAHQEWNASAAAAAKEANAANAAKEAVPQNEGVVMDTANTTPTKEPGAAPGGDDEKDPPGRPAKKARVSESPPEETTSGRASAVASSIEEASSPAPPVTLDVLLQYGGIPCGEELKMKALLSVAPAKTEKPKKAELVLALDESLSMGQRTDDCSAASLLGKFCKDLFTRGVPGVDLSLRVISFGTDVVDKKIGDTELVELNEKSRQQFLDIADEVDGRQSSTNISAPILRGVEILKSHREHLQNCIESGEATEEDLAPAQHVVVFTDGVANDGITNGTVMCDKIAKAVGDSNIFVHFIGLGSSINPGYITSATDNGKFGVFASAPSGKDIAGAYEEIFGLALETSMPLIVKIHDACGIEPRIEKLGMLVKKRSVLIDVRTPNNTTPGEYSWLKVTLMSNGEELSNVSKTVSSTWHSGKEPNDPNEEVQDAIEAEEVNNQMVEIQRTSQTIDDASQRMRQASATAESTGAYGAATLRRMNAIVNQAEEDAEKYRSLGEASSVIYAARSMTQSQYA